MSSFSLVFDCGSNAHYYYTYSCFDLLMEQWFHFNVVSINGLVFIILLLLSWFDLLIKWVCRLVEKWTFSLCSEMRFPVLEDIMANKVKIYYISKYITF